MKELRGEDLTYLGVAGTLESPSLTARSGYSGVSGSLFNCEWLRHSPVLSIDDDANRSGPAASVTGVLSEPARARYRQRLCNEIAAYTA